MNNQLLRLSALLLLALSALTSQAQLASGQIMFTGMNVDGNDDFSFVALAEIPANTTIWFTDNEWDGSALNSGEGFVSWTHTAVISAGSIVQVSSIGSGISANVGTATLGSGSFNVSGSNEVLYAYLGTETIPTTFLSAIANDGFVGNGELTTSGLTEGVNATAISGDEDVMEYVGPKNNQTTWSAYAALIADPNNWITEDGGGDQHNNGITPDIPFSNISFTLLSPPAEGDVMFTAFNADGNDGMAIVTLKDLPANTQIWFTDNEWNGFSIASGLGAFNDTAEGSFAWMDTVMRPAGTVITFENYTSAGMVPSIGTVTAGAIPNEGISGGSEVIYAYLGTEGMPTVFLTAIGNDGFGGNGTLDSTGLVDGVNAFSFSGGIDIAEYTGARLGESTFAAYQALIYNTANWVSQNAGGDQSFDGTAPDMPFNTTPFDTGSVDLVPPTAQTMNALSGTLSYVVFTELLDSATALDTANYVFVPDVTFDSAFFSASGDTVFLAHSTIQNGVAYSVDVMNVADTAGNVMDTTNFNIVWNASIPSLVITEIIHSPNTVEMIEVFNNGTTPINLGGLVWTDGTTGTFPMMTLAPDSVILFSTDPTSAASLMGETYYMLNNGLGSSSDILVIRNSLGQVVDSVEYLVAAPWPSAPIGIYANSIELVDASLDNNVGSNWTVPVQTINSTNGVINATPGIYPPPVVTGPTGPATIAFVASRAVVNEDAGSVDIIVSVLNASDSAITVDLELTAFATATEGSDFTYSTTQTFSFVANTTVTQDTISIAITDDLDAENAEYFTLKLMNGVNTEINSNASEFAVMILDNDFQAPIASNEIMLNYAGSYEHAPGSGSTAEIVGYDSASQRLFITNFEYNRVDIVDFSDPNAPDSLGAIDLSSYGDLTSIAVKNGILAVSAGNTVETDSGSVIFMNTSGTVLASVKAGALPDMITFNHAGTKVLTANEGQPNGPYTIDPEGSISIIDISGGVALVTQANVSHARFTHYNGQEAALRTLGVRITGPTGTNTAADMEPEYITISDDDMYAYVTCQENNAVAVVDIANDSIINILPLGYKDYSLSQNSLDANDQFSNIEMANWPIKGMYMPDAIGHFSVGGVDYLITANEGDAREYDTYEDVVRLSSSAYPLDSATFPFGNLLKQNIGRIQVINTNGDTDNDGDFDEIYALGGRSFSIFNASTGALVYDSGNDFEAITAADPVFGAIFNASNSNNNFKNRSDDKGPEPEGVLISEINGQIYAFIGLERIGGVMVYNVTNPTTPKFVDYKNSRDVSSFNGDNGPEGLIYIAPNQSPNGKGYVVVANEVSGTLSFYEVVTNIVETYTLNQTDLITNLNGLDIFEGGFSGMSLVPGETDEFYIVGDRGPNVVADNNVNAAGGAIKYFPTPSYAPKIHKIKAQGDTISILETMTMKRPDSTDASGLPNPAGFGGTGEIAWSDTSGTVIPSDLWGIDSEGIIEGLNNDFWIADEYGASVWHVDAASGVVINRYWPFAAQANNLPIDTIFKYRKANRGFEGVTMTPNGKVYACIQSGMENPDVAAGNNTRLLRILEIDPVTGNTQIFGYELEPGIGGSAGIRLRDWKLGDLVAVNNHEFLVLEHAERGGFNSKKVFKFDISNATPITTENFSGNTFEQLIDAAGAAGQGIQVVEKTMYLDLLANGWDLSLDKPEGLAIINDSTIAVVNDNDFGVDSPAEDGVIVATGKQTKLYIYKQPSALRMPLNFCEPIRVDMTGDLSFCQGDSVVFEVITGENYTWFNGPTDLGITSSTFTASASGDYYAMNSDAICGGSSRHFNVSVNIAPQAMLEVENTICENEMYEVVPFGFDTAAIASYAWSNSQTTSTIMVSTPGDYSLTVTDTNGCANVMMDTFNLIVQPLPMIALGADTAICDGASFALSAPSNLDQYLWNIGVINAGINVNAAGTYSVLVEDSLGCENADTIIVSVNANPSVDLGTDTSFCDGNSLTLSATAGMSSYAWSNSANTATVNTTTGGSFAVTITDANGCTAQDMILVTVDSLPVLSLENDTICANETATLTGPTGLYSFNWSNSAATQAINVSTAGTYTLTITNAFGCEDVASADLVVNALPISTIAGNNMICAGDTTVLDAGSFAGFVWTTGANTQTIDANMAGVYGVTVTDANGCENSDTINLMVSALPNVFAGFDASVCDGESIALNAIGASTYVWSNGTANGSSFTPTATAIYTVTGANANGCENTDEIEIAVNALPLVDAGADQEVCEGTQVTLSGSGAATYTWTNGVSNGVAFIANASANYTVTGVAANGCSNTDNVSVAVNDLPTTDLGANQGICNEQVITLDAGAGFASYDWNTGATTQTTTIDTAQAGIISVTVTDASGCEGEASVVVFAYVCVGVEELAETNNINVFPNPASSVINIDLADARDVASIQVMDITGRVMTTALAASSMMTVDVNSCAAGMYMINFMAENGAVISTKQLVVTK